MEDHGLSFHGFISLHWVFKICCYKRVSYRATQVKGRVIWCKWNPTTVTTTQRAHPVRENQQCHLHRRGQWTEKQEQTFQSRNPHTPSPQNFMFSCVRMKHRNGWQGASSPVEWATQKQVTFLLGSRFWQADPQSKLSLLNRTHQIIPPYTHYLQTTRVNITMEAGMKLSGQHPPLPAPAQK